MSKQEVYGNMFSVLQSIIVFVNYYLRDVFRSHAPPKVLWNFLKELYLTTHGYSTSLTHKSNTSVEILLSNSYCRYLCESNMYFNNREYEYTISFLPMHLPMEKLKPLLESPVFGTWLKVRRQWRCLCMRRVSTDKHVLVKTKKSEVMQNKQDYWVSCKYQVQVLGWAVGMFKSLQ